MRFRLILIIMLILLPVLNDRQPAHADSIIGNGTPYSCTDAAFTSALQSGGTLRFDCGSQPVTIDISPDAGGSGSKLVKADTIMDGGTLGQITISGGHAVQLFDIAPGVSLMIRNLILRDGADKGSAGAIHNGGTLNISHSTLSRNVASNGNGGAIENSSGASLTIADSTFSDNSAHSDDGSQYVTGGAIQNNGGLLAISNTIFTANLVINDGNGKQGGGNNGGAINNFQGTLRIDHSVFTSNAAIGTSTLDGKGGAISSNNGTITLTNVVFRQNTANYGGAYHGDFDQFTVRDTTFAENQATTGSGGAIDSTGGMLNVFNSTFSDNLAEARFGGAIGAGRATVMIANSTFANNSAQYGGAVQINNKPSQLTVLNSTFAGNKASNAGAALYNEAETTDNVQVMIANSIIAKSQAGDNCNAMIRSGGHNIEDGNTCQLTAAGDQPNTTPLIGMLGENDGPTQTIPLTEKSPAIAAGDTTICAATPVNSLDQRGVTRLQQGHCDIGAFEFAKDVQVSAPGLEATLEATSMMRNGGNNCASITGNFMKTDGSVFCFHGKAVQLYGSTMYPYWNVSGKIQRSGGWLKPEFTQYIDTIIKLARAAHLNTLRPTDYLTDAGQWNDPTVWKNMDYLVSQAGKNHMWVVLDISTYRQWMTNHSQKFLYNAADWAPYVKFITNRYRDSSVICQYSIAGEIKPEVNSGITPTQYVDFYRAVEDQIYSGDGGHHLISVGGLSYLNYKSGLPWQELYSLPHNDIAAIHVYSAGDRNITVPMVSTWAKANHKVFLVEEFGFKQEIGDEKRANSFADIYSWSHQHDAAGIIFWNLGPEVATSSYEVSDQTPLTWAVVQKYAPAQ